MDQNLKLRLFSRLFPIKNRWKNVLYIHIPFCIKRCDFCIYFSKVPQRKNEITEFLERHLVRQIDQYGPVFDAVNFDELYFGGGTPTIVPPQELSALYDSIPNFDRIPLKMTEASPRTVKEEHIELFYSRGFKYVSLGIQTLERETLIAHNREVVDDKRLSRIVRGVEAGGMISNVDLIFFLKSGTVDDLPQAEYDLRYVMEELQPTSITIHSEYNSQKSYEKQLRMIETIREAMERSPGYVCTNGLLRDADIESDLVNGAEYRLMRKDQDFTFYLIGKVPSAFRFGHNILALGDYGRFKLRTNYFYVSDYYPKHTLAEVLRGAKMVEFKLAAIRDGLGLAHDGSVLSNAFFSGADERQRFEEIVNEEGFPYLHEAAV